ncbi:MAG: hypothetical protein N2204_09125 [Anaerolineae bacterium]|nr:hypothetical protein [Anaerolineae bacterium]
MGILAIVAYATRRWRLCKGLPLRGVLQPFYELRGTRWAVLFVELLFVVSHLSNPQPMP